MRRGDKQLLTEEMYLRVGELAAHFGRFDMYAKALLDLLTKQRPSRADPAETRGLIRSLERDVVQVIALYLDLAELIRGIQNGVRFPERTVADIVPLTVPIVS